jgi:hypothetical protein
MTSPSYHAITGHSDRGALWYADILSTHWVALEWVVWRGGYCRVHIGIALQAAHKDLRSSQTCRSPAGTVSSEFLASLLVVQVINEDGHHF